MTIVNFNDINYQIAGAQPLEGAVIISSLPGAELVTLHNLLNSNMGVNKRVKKFSDKKTALKRVAAKLVEYDTFEELTDEQRDKLAADALVKKKAAIALSQKKSAAKAKVKKANTLARRSGHEPKKARKLRGMHFVFRPDVTIRTCKGSITSRTDDTRTLRQRAVDLLTGDGATFAQVIETVKKFDDDRGKPTDPDTVDRRTYELIRLCHYYLGYGLKMKDDVIIAYSDPSDAPGN